MKVTQLCLTLCNPTDCSPWNSPGQNTGVGSLSLLQGIFPTQGSNPGLLHAGGFFTSWVIRKQTLPLQFHKGDTVRGKRRRVGLETLCFLMYFNMRYRHSCYVVVYRSVVSDSFAIPWTVACLTPLFMEFSREEYWSGLPFPSPGDLPNPGVELRSPTLQVDALQTELPGNPLHNIHVTY